MIGTMSFAMFKAQVGRQMWCRKCEELLDCRGAVGVDAYQGEELKSTFVLCAECWDRGHNSIRMNAKRDGLRLAVSDGRLSDDGGHMFATLRATLGARGRFQTQHRSGTKTVWGVSVKLDTGTEADGCAWFAYQNRSADGRRAEWRLVHCAKGLAAGPGAYSLRGAISDAVGRLMRATPERLKEVLA